MKTGSTFAALALTTVALAASPLAARAETDPQGSPAPVAAQPPVIEGASPAPVPVNPASSVAEDAFASGLGLGRRIGLGGYGEAQVTRHDDETEAKLSRFVLFVGYRFSDRARLYSEIEVEDGDEIEMEQAYLDLSPSRKLGVRAGLVLVPLGISNLYHEPPTFNGVERPLVDQMILPSTWRELGGGIFGELAEGLQYQVLLVNGLNASRFNSISGIREGRGQGLEVHAEDPAVTGRLSFSRVLGLDVGAGFYFGGAGQDVAELGGVKVGIGELDARYARNGLQLRAEYARVMISGADRVTDYLRLSNPAAEAIGSAEQGFYAEAGYNLLQVARGTDQELIPFVRYENLNTKVSVPDVLDPGSTEGRQFLLAGLTYKPHPQIAFKVDYRRALTDASALSGPGAGESVSVLEGANRFSAGVGFMF